MHTVPFNRPFVSDRAFEYIRAAVENHHLAGNGPFTRRCQDWLQRETGCRRALLTHSCTAALEMAALLARVGPGDEVIMPSYTFVSTANAFVLRGATPVFVDIRPDTLNLDERRVADAVTPRTRAIVVVHYAGVACDMDPILELAASHGLMVIEDAAQALSSTYKDRPLGSFGALAALSFHETKNVIAGEGGALLINDPALVERAEILWEKGTNRNAFHRGHVDRYTWMDVGSSFLPSEVTAALLWSQLEEADAINKARRRLWDIYQEAFADSERNGMVRRPVVPPWCGHNGHLYYLLAPDSETRAHMLQRLNQAGINAIFHYVPLHSSPAGRSYGRCQGSLAITDDLSGRVMRLPLWSAMSERDMNTVIDGVKDVLRDSNVS